jgi:hypothetical protein
MMKEANDNLKIARGRLLRGRTTTIIGKSPMSQAVDAARNGLDILIKYFDGDGSVPNVHKALRNIALLLEPFQSKNEDVHAAYMDVIEAEYLVQESTYDVAPGGETIKRPRR